jgi:hypothetical protein
MKCPLRVRYAKVYRVVIVSVGAETAARCVWPAQHHSNGHDLAAQQQRCVGNGGGRPIPYRGKVMLMGR